MVPPTNLRLCLVRHGTTKWNEEQRQQGRLPGIGLNQCGREQVVALARSLNVRTFSAVLSSPRQRATETAEMLKERLGLHLPVIKRGHFDEWDIPIWEGLTLREIAESFPNEFRVYMDEPDRLELSGAESLHDVQRRSLAGIQDLQNDHTNGTVLVVTHSSVIRVVVCGLLSIPLSLYRQLDSANAALTVIEVSDRPLLRTFNWHPDG